MPIYRSKAKGKNVAELGEGFFTQLLPGLKNDKDGIPIKDWVKYLRISIAVIRLAEYDYLSPSDGPDWKSAKSFLFGKNNLFTTVCQLLKVNPNMARLKIISYKKSGIVGDPIFNSMLDEYTDKETLSLNPTSEDINRIIDNVRKKQD